MIPVGKPPFPAGVFCPEKHRWIFMSEKNLSPWRFDQNCQSFQATCCKVLSECSTSVGEGDRVATTAVWCDGSVKELLSRWVSLERRKGTCKSSLFSPSCFICLCITLDTGMESCPSISGLDDNWSSKPLEKQPKGARSSSPASNRKLLLPSWHIPSTSAGSSWSTLRAPPWICCASASRNSSPSPPSRRCAAALQLWQPRPPGWNRKESATPRCSATWKMPQSCGCHRSLG